MPRDPQDLHSHVQDPPSHPDRAFALHPVRYRSMAEQIATTIRQAIADGKLRPGARLLEVQMASEMGTSRAPLREALIQLEREGLVVRQPNRGTFVAELTEDMVREVAGLRGVLEGFAASLAAKRLTSEDFERLEKILKEMLAAARREIWTAQLSAHPSLQGVRENIRDLIPAWLLAA